MKLISLLILGLISTQAFSASVKSCEKKILLAGYAHYQDENNCDGYGKKSDCALINLEDLGNGQKKYKVECAYAGEPDYSDYLDVDYTVDMKTCEILKTEVNECFND